MVENIVVGNLVEGLTEEMVGIGPEEETIRISTEQAKELDFFLPRILVEAGLFKTTSEIKRIAVQRMKSNVQDPLSKELWRKVGRPEMTFFKVGKKAFWVIIGE